jgi:hypothetical protein
MAGGDDETDTEGAASVNGANATAEAAPHDVATEGLPWYVKAVIVLVLLIVAFVLVIDLFEFAAAV